MRAAVPSSGVMNDKTDANTTRARGNRLVQANDKDDSSTTPSETSQQTLNVASEHTSGLRSSDAVPSPAPSPSSHAETHVDVAETQENIIPGGFELLAHPIFRRASRANVPSVPHATEHGECAICLGKPKCAVKPKDCSHVFCLRCLRQWQSSGRYERPTCPVCKQSLRCGLEHARSAFRSNYSEAARDDNPPSGAE
jgi:hypothetical protein